MTKSASDTIRRIYEPLYHRRLTDAEVQEIDTNLTAFARWMLEAAGMRIRKKGGVTSDVILHSDNEHGYNTQQETENRSPARGGSLNCH